MCEPASATAAASSGAVVSISEAVETNRKIGLNPTIFSVYSAWFHAIYRTLLFNFTNHHRPKLGVLIIVNCYQFHFLLLHLKLYSTNKLIDYILNKKIPKKYEKSKKIMKVEIFYDKTEKYTRICLSLFCIFALNSILAK